MLRPVPLFTAGGLGLVDGVLEGNDAKRKADWEAANPGKTWNMLSEWALWAEIGAIGGGAILGMAMRPGPMMADMADQLVYSGGTLIAKRAGVMAQQQFGQGQAAGWTQIRARQFLSPQGATRVPVGVGGNSGGAQPAIGKQPTRILV